VARRAEKRAWSGAYWQFDGDFVEYDMSRQQWVQAIRDAPIPARK
jgi:endoglucanase